MKSGFSWAAAVKGSVDSITKNRSVSAADTDTAVSSIAASPHSSVDSSPMQYDASPGISQTHAGSSTSNPHLPHDKIQLPQSHQSNLNIQMGIMNISDASQPHDGRYLNYQTGQQQQQQQQQQHGAHQFPSQTQLQHPSSAWGPSTLNIAPPGAQPSYESEQQMQYRLQPSISEDAWKNQFFPQHQQRAHVQPQNNIGVPNALFSQDDRNSDSVDTESDDLLLIQSMRNLRFDLDSPAPDESGGNVAFGWGNLEGDKR